MSRRSLPEDMLKDIEEAIPSRLELIDNSNVDLWNSYSFSFLTTSSIIFVFSKKRFKKIVDEYEPRFRDRSSEIFQKPVKSSTQSAIPPKEKGTKRHMGECSSSSLMEECSSSSLNVPPQKKALLDDNLETELTTQENESSSESEKEPDDAGKKQPDDERNLE